MINHYEILYLVAASYTEDELLPIKEKVKEFIKKAEGEIVGEDSFGKKKLAYPINKNHQGYYLLYEFDLDGAKLQELDRNLKLTNELLRHIVVKRTMRAKAPAKIDIKKVEVAKTLPAEEKKIDKDKDNKKIKLEDLDQKLDEILKGDIL